MRLDSLARRARFLARRLRFRHRTQSSRAWQRAREPGEIIFWASIAAAECRAIGRLGHGAPPHYQLGVGINRPSFTWSLGAASEKGQTRKAAAEYPRQNLSILSPLLTTFDAEEWLVPPKPICPFYNASE